MDNVRTIPYSPSKPFVGKVNLNGKSHTVVRFELPNTLTTTSTVDGTLHHIFIFDRSGSMSRDIDDLIDDMKRSVALVNKDDYITIIWFSGEGQFRTVVKCAKNSEGDIFKILDTLRSTIGCTCFSDPLEEMKTIVYETKMIADLINVVIFTDGQPVTSWSTEEEYNRIVRILGDLKVENSDKIIAINTIGYGNYYNRDLLVMMSSTTDYGSTFHASEIKDYTRVVLHSKETIQDLSGKRVKIVADGCDIVTQSISHSNLYRDKAVVRLTKRDNIVNLIFDDDLDTVSYIVDGQAYTAYVPAKYSMTMLDDVMYHYAYQMFYNGRKSDGVNVLNFIGNKAIMEDALSSFTASEVGEFINKLRGYAFKSIARPNKKFKRNTYIADETTVTVVDILNYLASINSKYRPNKSYKRIGKKVVDKDDLFTESGDPWCDMSNIVLNKDRLNVSIKFKVFGSVSTGGINGLPKVVPAHIFRTHTIIKDGSLNMKTLNVTIDEDKIDESNPIYQAIKKYYKADKGFYSIDLRRFKLIPRESNLTIEELYNEEVALLEAEASSKVINYLINKMELPKDPHDPNANGLVPQHLYTPAQWDALISLGLNRSMTYNPKNRETKSAEDYIIMREVRTSMKGFSTLPPIEKVLDKVASGKNLTASENLIRKKYDIYEGSSAENLENYRRIVRNVINASRLKVSSAKLIRSMTGDPWFTSTETDKFEYVGNAYTLVVNYVKTDVAI